MSKARGKAKGRTTPRSKSTAIQQASSAAPTTKAFDEVIDLIRRARQRALHAVNAELIDLYWRIGEAISRRIAKDGWGQGTVAELAAHSQRRDPGVRGFSPQNLWRMRQFFEAYRDQPKLSTLLRELPWFNRALNCLVAVELKIDEFKPEYLGKLEFYLEALDRDVRKTHEGPSIGLLLCATKDSEVVEYALSRAMSPTLVAGYRTRLPEKRLLQAKLHEFYQRAIEDTDPVTKPRGKARRR